ncbi:MAG: thioredoxin domain-containing protein [Phycisphaerae bacterium]
MNRRRTTIAVFAAALGLCGCPSATDSTARNAFELTAADHILATGDPVVTVIEYGDFQCPVCGRFFAETYPTIKAEFVDTGRVRWVFRQFPLRNVHPRAEAAAQASECASDQSEFWQYYDVLFANQGKLEDSDLNTYAGQIGLDAGTFQSCTTGGTKAARVQTDVDAGKSAGVTGTPTFFINGTRVAGFQTVEQFRALLEAAGAK